MKHVSALKEFPSSRNPSTEWLATDDGTLKYTVLGFLLEPVRYGTRHPGVLSLALRILVSLTLMLSSSEEVPWRARRATKDTTSSAESPPAMRIIRRIAAGSSATVPVVAGAPVPPALLDSPGPLPVTRGP